MFRGRGFQREDGPDPPLLGFASKDQLIESVLESVPIDRATHAEMGGTFQHSLEVFFSE
jgi:hypothetical protein